MAKDLDTLLATFPNDHLTVKVCKGVFKAMPTPVDMPSARSLDAAVRELDPSATADVVARARARSMEEPAQTVLRVAEVMDAADSGFSVVFNIASAVGLGRSGAGDLSALEQRQVTDLALKTAGLTLIASSLFPGREPVCITDLQRLSSGRALLAWFAAMEIGMPFAERDWTAGGNIVDGLVQMKWKEAHARLTVHFGTAHTEALARVLPTATAFLDEHARLVLDRIESLQKTILSHLPGAGHLGDKMGNALAIGTDALPIYRLLVPRLVAEFCAATALGRLQLSPLPPPAAATPGGAPVGATPLPATPLPVVPPADGFRRTTVPFPPRVEPPVPPVEPAFPAVVLLPPPPVLPPGPVRPPPLPQATGRFEPPPVPGPVMPAPVSPPPLPGAPPPVPLVSGKMPRKG